MDDEVPGAVGTSASFALRLGQTIFSAASLLFMSLGVEFHNYTAFCFLVTIMGLVIPWSMTLALIDIYSVLIRCSILQLGILLFTALAFLTLAAASSIAGIVDVLHRADETFCSVELCSRYQVSSGLAFLSCFLSMASSLSNLWLLPSLTR
ncbi:unnamed protein product [Withania somnifera]